MMPSGEPEAGWMHNHGTGPEEIAGDHPDLAGTSSNQQCQVLQQKMPPKRY
jgi:hypothetical protein